MIKNTELRIGNYVNFHDDDTVFEVTEISSSGIGVKNEIEKTWIELDRLYGIPLTPPLLEKCGFEWETDKRTHLQFDLGNRTIVTFYFKDININQLQLYCCDNLIGMFSCEPPKYLHQLQNLIHSIGGVELVVNVS